MTHQSTKLDQASVPDSRDCSGPHITAEMPPLSAGEGQESTAGGWPPVGPECCPTEPRKEFKKTIDQAQFKDNTESPTQGFSIPLCL